MTLDIQYRVTASKANVREDPAADARVKAQVFVGGVVHVVGEPVGGWFPVEFHGWMHESVIQIIKPS